MTDGELRMALRAAEAAWKEACREVVVLQREAAAERRRHEQDVKGLRRALEQALAEARILRERIDAEPLRRVAVWGVCGARVAATEPPASQPVDGCGSGG